MSERMTRVLAGPSAVCKTVRIGFDSLPRLQNKRLYMLGRRVGRWAVRRAAYHHHRPMVRSGARAFWSGIHHAIETQAKPKPPNGPSVRALNLRVSDLVSEIATARYKLDQQREKLIVAQKELSRLKRESPR